MEARVSGTLTPMMGPALPRAELVALMPPGEPVPLPVPEPMEPVPPVCALESVVPPACPLLEAPNVEPPPKLEPLPPNEEPVPPKLELLPPRDELAPAPKAELFDVPPVAPVAEPPAPVPVELEAAYNAAFAEVPRRWRNVFDDPNGH